MHHCRATDSRAPAPALATCQQELRLYEQVINQKRKDKNKVYKLHKPFTACIAKGKAATPSEFRNKVGLLTHSTRKIVLAIKTFRGNPHDSKTIRPLLEQLTQTGQPLPEEVIYNRGGRGQKTIEGVTITTPSEPKITDARNNKRRLRRRFRRRAGTEAIISHLKSDHRMDQNYLSWANSPDMNAMLAAVVWNMKKWMERVTRTDKAFCRVLEKWALPIACYRLTLTS